MIFSLPPQITTRSLERVLDFCSRVLACEDEVVSCDASRLRFVDPIGLCLLAATCNQLEMRGHRIEIDNLSFDLESYLQRMDLFKECRIDEDSDRLRRDKSSSLLEICRLTQYSQADHLSQKVSRSIVGEMPDYDPNATPDEMTGYLPHERTERMLSYIFSELFENSLTHGRKAGFGSASVWVCTQYYRKTDSISIGVVDDGCGLRRSLAFNPEIPVHGDMDAIESALLPKVTCNKDLGLMGTESVNQGLGLTVIDEIVREAGGNANYASGNAVISMSPGRIDHKNISGWNGMIVGIEVGRGPIKKLNLSEVINKFRVEETGISVQFV